MSPTPPSIEEFARLVPQDLTDHSGKVFYSGRQAFSIESPLYILGINPGGNPENYRSETVGDHTQTVLHSHPDDWSAYRDESWEGQRPGTYGMAPRVLHLLRELNFAPGSVPSSNVVFVRSQAEADIAGELNNLAQACWPFHEHVIRRIRPKVILCLGSTAGRLVCQRVGAHRLVGEFVEQNRRRWASRAFEAPSGLRVVVATHPSRVNWASPSTDPSPLVSAALHDA